MLMVSVVGLNTSCSSNQPPKKIDELPIKFTIIPENNSGLYYVEWKDTLGQAEGYNQMNRPIELWCIIKNQNKDTIGYYKGLSTPQKLAYFETKDTVITLEFKTGLNLFTEISYAQTEEKNKSLWDLNVEKMTDFKPIKINIEKKLRQEQQTILEKTHYNNGYSK